MIIRLHWGFLIFKQTQWALGMWHSPLGNPPTPAMEVGKIPPVVWFSSQPPEKFGVRHINMEGNRVICDDGLGPWEEKFQGRGCWDDETGNNTNCGFTNKTWGIHPWNKWNELRLTLISGANQWKLGIWSMQCKNAACRVDVSPNNITDLINGGEGECFVLIGYIPQFFMWQCANYNVTSSYTLW